MTSLDSGGVTIAAHRDNLVIVLDLFNIVLSQFSVTPSLLYCFEILMVSGENPELFILLRDCLFSAIIQEYKY